MSLRVGWYHCSYRMSILFLLIHNTGKCMHTVQIEVNSDEVDNDNQPAGRNEGCVDIPCMHIIDCRSGIC